MAFMVDMMQTDIACESLQYFGQLNEKVRL
jgi:hypothetical protein